MAEAALTPKLRPTNVRDYEEVSFERSHDGRVAVISWNPATRMNALSVKLTDELVAAVEEAQADEHLNIVIFRGEGGYFSVGDDLNEMAEGAWGNPNQVMRRILEVLDRFSHRAKWHDVTCQEFAECLGFCARGK